MRISEAHPIQSENQRLTLSSFHQPQTAKQLSRRTGLPFESCRDALRKLRAKGMVACLNEHAQRSRVYWPTRLGWDFLRYSTEAPTSPPSEPPEAEWSDYGWVCFSHRSAIIRALTEPLQPSTIKRRARLMIPGLRMSANNVRDVIKLFLLRELVRPVRIRKRAHNHYELTERGQRLRQLLINSGVPA